MAFKECVFLFLLPLVFSQSNNRSLAAPNQDGPINVAVDLYILNLGEVDVVKNEFKLQMYYRQEWQEVNRTVGTGFTKPNDAPWSPDVFFTNEKKSKLHDLMVPNTFTKTAEGKIKTSSRVSLTLGCPMDLWAFPFDTQICELTMESYKYTAQDVLLSWKSNDSAQVLSELVIPGYTLEAVDTIDRIQELASGTYSSLQVLFKLKRDSLPLVYRLFIPLSLLVLASWSSFLLHRSSVLPRLIVGCVTTFTTAQIIFRQDQLFSLPYLTSLDAWVTVSAFFVFAAFFQYIFLLYQEGRHVAIKELSSDAEACKPSKLPCITQTRGLVLIDTVSKIAFPCAYALFNAVYLFAM